MPRIATVRKQTRLRMPRIAQPRIATAQCTTPFALCPTVFRLCSDCVPTVFRLFNPHVLFNDAVLVPRCVLPYKYRKILGMLSKLMKLCEIRGAGEFFCVVSSVGDDKQWGPGDPCSVKNHPDDVTMIMVGVYELYMMANDTSLVEELYPNLLKAFGYYKGNYNTSQWHLPYIVHETYDAVKETPAITGEGNNGYSFYNAVNYLAGLSCMIEFATLKGDKATEAEARNMLGLAQASLQEHFWQPALGAYMGDTIGTKPVQETNGDVWHSSDGQCCSVLFSLFSLFLFLFLCRSPSLSPSLPLKLFHK